MTMKDTRKPTHSIRRGALEASLWENQGKNGVFYNLTLRRHYRTGDGNFGKTDAFSPGDLAELSFLVREADAWLRSQPKPDADTEAAA